ncbi:PD-(D/E)XK nuclease family protein [Marinifilum flexuosum]|uniref:PD-(D/E)XK nuclease superfamily protein n=1 Tax=Marinifilum flexuosum TaxID=1117708 RepID=A0A419X9D1_9BACT|nr:PD-(D/E)XK nuclease family protein [Marinifilum flexuosum]RKE04169.1 PD-(D/E)XK nuclease superfamily protein [Marinifilum flexuosum]
MKMNSKLKYPQAHLNKTYLEILKVHNKEVPMANMLAYLFKPDENHQLGTTFLTALLSTTCYEIKGEKGDVGTILKQNCVSSSGLSVTPNLNFDNIKVETEVPTNGQKEEDKRIDILIEAENFVVCIEFKIDHDLDNPLEIYQTYVEENYPNKYHYFLVLAPYRKQPIGAAEKYLKTKNDFKLVILSHFVEQVKLSIPDHYFEEKSSNVYAQYVFDFIQTIENRKFRNQIVNKLEDVKKTIEKAGISSQIIRKWNGGYLLVSKKDHNLKVRVNEGTYQLEKWSFAPENKKLEEITLVDLADILKVVKSDN